MIFETFVEFRRQRSEFRQVVPGDRRQIVMLVVITHVERQPIDRPIITVGLLIRIIRVMFLDPTCAHRMQPDGKEKRKCEIKESRPAAKINHGYVVRDGACKIYAEPSVPHGDRF